MTFFLWSSTSVVLTFLKVCFGLEPVEVLNSAKRNSFSSVLFYHESILRYLRKNLRSHFMQMVFLLRFESAVASEFSRTRFNSRFPPPDPIEVGFDTIIPLMVMVLTTTSRLLLGRLKPCWAQMVLLSIYLSIYFPCERLSY